jgi:hypothetical protein
MSASSGGHAIDMRAARPAECHVAPKFGAGHPQHIAQHQEKRHIAINIDAIRAPIDFDPKANGSNFRGI